MFSIIALRRRSGCKWLGYEVDVYYELSIRLYELFTGPISGKIACMELPSLAIALAQSVLTLDNQG